MPWSSKSGNSSSTGWLIDVTPRLLSAIDIKLRLLFQTKHKPSSASQAYTCCNGVPFCSNFTCGVSPTNCRKSSLLKIIGGQAAESCSWPWRAALYETSDDARTLIFLCGASIVAPNWLLTAAHCLKNHSCSVRRFRILLSKSEELEDDDGDGLYGISEIRVHPSFDKDTMYYDLALLK
uniref:Peptidase S1 domain-containing protein n=1 Tax=Romanomermis culicivorax TaxID=13658 RepID=A0A915JSE5_ROMCU